MYSGNAQSTKFIRPACNLYTIFFNCSSWTMTVRFVLFVVGSEVRCWSWGDRKVARRCDFHRVLSEAKKCVWPKLKGQPHVLRLALLSHRPLPVFIWLHQRQCIFVPFMIISHTLIKTKLFGKWFHWVSLNLSSIFNVTANLTHKFSSFYAHSRTHSYTDITVPVCSVNKFDWYESHGLSIWCNHHGVVCFYTIYIRWGVMSFNKPSDFGLQSDRKEKFQSAFPASKNRGWEISCSCFFTNFVEILVAKIEVEKNAFHAPYQSAECIASIDCRKSAHKWNSKPPIQNYW